MVVRANRHQKYLHAGQVAISVPVNFSQILQERFVIILQKLIHTTVQNVRQRLRFTWDCNSFSLEHVVLHFQMFLATFKSALKSASPPTKLVSPWLNSACSGEIREPLHSILINITSGYLKSYCIDSVKKTAKSIQSSWFSPNHWRTDAKVTEKHGLKLFGI